MLFEPYVGEASPSLASYAFALRPYPTCDEFSSISSADHLPTSPKRLRPHTDVDGERSAHLQIKKRRLRRDLITSRLSRPFATPSTYISGSGNFKITVRNRRRPPTRNLLRKIALLNWARQRRAESKKPVQSTQTTPSRNVDVSQKQEPAVKQTFSPLGLSNYDALDLEDPFEDEPWVDIDTEDDVNSNFNQRLDSYLENHDNYPKQQDADPYITHPIFSDNFTMLEHERDNEFSTTIITHGERDIGHGRIVILQPKVAV
jgi:hypothetical protein